MLKTRKKEIDEIADTIILKFDNKIKEKIEAESENTENLDYGIIGVAGVISSIINTINNIHKKGGDKIDENRLIDFIKDLVNIDFSSKINDYLKMIEIWITNFVSRLIPMITSLSISTFFDMIEKITFQLGDLKTKESISEFIMVCIDNAERNTPKIIQFLVFVICEIIKSMIRLTSVYLQNNF